jgi:diaminopimelate decarboxylase
MEIINGKYTSGGVNLLEVATEFGTPLYVYDTDSIHRQYEVIRAAFSGVDLTVKYACKANTNLSILEVELGMRAGFHPSEILFTPNGVDYNEIRKAVELGVTINIDNLSVLELFGNDYGNTVPCCIRFNPHIQAGGNSHIQTGHIDSKFGISVYQLRHVERIVKSCSMRVEGLHIHTGSEILDSSVFLRMAELMFDMAQTFPDLRFLDFGSGFKVAYKEGDYTTDIEELGREMTVRFQDFCKQYGRSLQLWFEPGKYLVSDSGLLLVKVNVVKQTLATVFAGVDSGQNHLIRPMFYDAYHHQ